jgi:hypothetical protein
MGSVFPTSWERKVHAVFLLERISGGFGDVAFVVNIVNVPW